MMGPQNPFEPRRRKELRSELIERAHAWLPDWRPREDRQDFVIALLDIVSRLESEVTQRLDKIPDKVFRGFLHWLGVTGQAGRAARLPIVFSMTPGADPVLAHPPLQVQATPAQTDTSQAADPVTFETDDDLMISRGRLATVVAVEPAADQFFLPHAGFSTLEPPTPRPDAWRATSDAQQAAMQLQLEPALALDTLPTLYHEPYGEQYRVIKADGTLVTIEPPLRRNVTQGDVFTAATAFDPFGDRENNRQEHALYIGSEAVLNVPAAARIAIQSLGSAGTGVQWSYWGKSIDDDTNSWRPLAPPALVNGDVVLSKPEGAVEITKVGGHDSRWLRAVHAPGVVSPIPPVSGVQLTVNCGDDWPKKCPPDPTTRSTVAAEAIANTTPLVLDIPFFPLGREPKLFDAFYVGSQEAFSKPNASVEICLEAYGSTTDALVASPIGDGAEVLVFGAGQGQLHRLFPTANPAVPLSRASSVRPPFSDTGIASVVASSAPLNDPLPGSKLSSIARTDDTIVAVTAGNDGWLWLQHKLPGQSRWIRLGAIHSPALGSIPSFDPQKPPKVAVFRDSADTLRAVGINGGVLFETRVKLASTSNAPPPWTPIENNWADWVHVVPICSPARPGSGADLAPGWLGVRASGRVGVFQIDADGNSEFDRLLVSVQADAAVEPIAVDTGGGDALFVSRSGGDLVAWSVDADVETGRLRGPDVLGGITWTASAPQGLAVVFVNRRGDGRQELATWIPDPDLTASAHADGKAAYRSAPFDRAVGIPAVLPDRIAVPGIDGAVLSLPFSVNGLAAAVLNRAQVGNALVVTSVNLPATANDFVETEIDHGKPSVVRLTADATANGTNRYWLPLPQIDFDEEFTAARVYRFQENQEFAGTIVGTSTIDTDVQAEANDERAKDHTHVIVGVGTSPVELSVHRIADVDDTTSPWTITVEPPIDDPNNVGAIAYIYVKPGATANGSAVRVLPMLDVALVDPAVAAAVGAGGAYLEGFSPAPNALAFGEPAPAAALILLDAWTRRPPASAQVTLIGNVMYGALSVVEAAKTGNPTLSWEYWDGSAWWKIPDVNDGTGNLQQTGVVTFCVPEGLKPTDVAGRTNHWIRARLIAGDYGKEAVTVTSKVDPNDPKITTQTIDRSLAGITPPQYVSVDLRYSVCCPAWPDYVLTADGNAVRDQTAANRIDGAAVEIFAPLGETIREAASGVVSAGDDQRAIYLGFDERLESGPITVLFLVDERQHDAAFPLQVEVLRERGFERLAGSDATRGLNESGIVSFTLSTPPPPVGLFGVVRYWLRVRPSDRFTGEWKPSIRAAFLNGALAVAAETQGMERLGSSDGSPGQRVTLARVPVVKDTLELRINEPLGEEDEALLLTSNPTAVVKTLPNGAAGKWVLWQRVDDLAEGDANARIYSLDHETGTITFGDGQNGRIPSIGLDSIVAVRYRRGGGDTANRVTAWTQLTLISPLPGVQAVAAPEGAAGGSNPEGADAVVQFAPASLLMRGRAITLRDLEVLARQFSPDVAQARALPSPRGARVVVAMRGRDPRPNAAQRRELTRFLSEQTMPMLADRGAMAVVVPRLVPLRVGVSLAVDRIESSGTVTQAVRERIQALLDPATGGDGTGWPLGAVPGEADIASAIVSLPHVEEIVAIDIVVDSTGTAVNRIGGDQLVTVTPERITTRLQLVQEEVA